MVDVNFKGNLSKTQTCPEPRYILTGAERPLTRSGRFSHHAVRGGGVELYNPNEVNEDESQV